MQVWSAFSFIRLMTRESIHKSKVLLAAAFSCCRSIVHCFRMIATMDGQQLSPSFPLAQLLHQLDLLTTGATQRGALPREIVPGMEALRFVPRCVPRTGPEAARALCLPIVTRSPSNPAREGHRAATGREPVIVVLVVECLIGFPSWHPLLATSRPACRTLLPGRPPACPSYQLGALLPDTVYRSAWQHQISAGLSPARSVLPRLRWRQRLKYVRCSYLHENPCCASSQLWQQSTGQAFKCLGSSDPGLLCTQCTPLAAGRTVHLRQGGEQAVPLPIPAADGARSADAGQHPAARLLSCCCSNGGSRGIRWQHAWTRCSRSEATSNSHYLQHSISLILSPVEASFIAS
jgi:hypothetical protein